MSKLVAPENAIVKYAEMTKVINVHRAESLKEIRKQALALKEKK